MPATRKQCPWKLLFSVAAIPLKYKLVKPTRVCPKGKLFTS
nr:MAG TPA: hypothetical protein [Microviridae sp.]